jgi:tetratricopeptide (TPR) repeat protein
MHLTLVSSSQSQWAAKGREYFSHRLYRPAAACFNRAEQWSDAKLSLAYYQMSRAKLKRVRGDTPDVRKALFSAAEELEVCARLEEVGDPRNIYYHAGTCFEAAQEYFRAATLFVKAERHDYAVQVLFNAQDFSHGIDILLDYRGELSTELFSSLLDTARRHFFNRRLYRCVDLRETSMKY